jgi:hypothetical protein
MTGPALLLLLAAAAPAPAAPPPFAAVDQVDSFRGCTILIGAEPPGGGVAPVRAVCHWPDLAVEDLADLLLDYEGYGRFIPCMVELRTLWTHADRALVWQFDRIGPGLAPRESRTVMTHRAVPGGFTVRWEADPTPFAARAGSVVMPRNEGFWWVTAARGGGVDLVEQVFLDPGGRLPAWVVNWYQTYGVAEQLRLLHGLARGDGAGG